MSGGEILYEPISKNYPQSFRSSAWGWGFLIVLTLRAPSLVLLSWDQEVNGWTLLLAAYKWALSLGLLDFSRKQGHVLALFTISTVDEIGVPYLAKQTNKTPTKQTTKKCRCFKRLFPNLSVEIQYQKEKVRNICKWKSIEFEICWCYIFPFSASTQFIFCKRNILFKNNGNNLLLVPGFLMPGFSGFMKGLSRVAHYNFHCC